MEAVRWLQDVRMCGPMALAAQRRIVAGWKAAGEGRDLSIVEIVDHDVAGAADTASSLQAR